MRAGAVPPADRSSRSTTVETAIEAPCDTARRNRSRTPGGLFLSSAMMAFGSASSAGDDNLEHMPSTKVAGGNR
jgi:hypothetical protein